MGRKILITGAGSGLGEGTAIGLARDGHDVIATAQTWPQVTALRLKEKALALPTLLNAEKLDLLDPYDVTRARASGISTFSSTTRASAKAARSLRSLSISCDETSRSTSLRRSPDPACRENLGCGRNPREGRLRLVNGRPLQSAGVLCLCRDETCARGDCGGDARRN